MTAGETGRMPYGWVVVGVMFVAQMLAIGTTSYGFALLVKPISAEFGLPRADVNLGLMILLIGMAIASPLVGKLLDRIPGRIMVALGAVLFGLGAVSIALAKSLWVMAAAAFFLLALGTAILGPLAAATLTSRWFDEGRGRALGVVSVATSAGGFALMPVMALMVEQLGWRTALAALGLLVTLLVGGLALFFIREPARASAPGTPQPAVDPDARWTAKRLLRTADFWLIALAVGLLFAVDQALLASLVAYGTDLGFSLAASAMLVSAISISAIVGKLVVGSLADRVDLRWLFVVLAVMTELFLAILLAQPGYVMLMAASLIVGAAVGGSSPLWASFIAARFGLASYGGVMGLMVMIQVPLTLTALRYIGHVYDVDRSYSAALVAFMVVVAIAALVILPVRLRRAAAETPASPLEHQAA